MKDSRPVTNSIAAASAQGISALDANAYLHLSEQA